MIDMFEKDKELLLKDLCARLPYHPKIQIYNDSWEGCQEGEFDSTLYFHHVEAFLCDRIEILPYLRPMSSMTEEEVEELNNIVDKELKDSEPYFVYEQLTVDFYLSHHLDNRLMIEKGLALEALEGMYK